MRDILLSSIKNRIGIGELFLADDIHDKSMTDAAIKTELVRLVKAGILNRYSYGVYFLPGNIEPDASSAIELRYISRGDQVFGFYTGDGFITSLNGIKPSLDNKIEIMTNRATSGKKTVYMFSKRFTLRKPYYPVDQKNVTLNAFLSYISMTSLHRIKENYSILANYVKRTHLGADDVMEMASHFPTKTASKLLASDLYRSLWKH